MGAAESIGVPARFELASVVSVELSGPLPTIDVRRDRAVLIVAWLCDEPIGMILRKSHEVSSPRALASAIGTELGGRVAEAATRHGIADFVAVTEAGLAHDVCPVRDRQRSASELGEPISVVIATRDRPGQLRQCLDSLLESMFQRFEIVVVDNASRTDAVARMCRDYAEQHPQLSIRCVLEERPGLSRARNAGIAAAHHELIAFIDDDERAHRTWLAAISSEFSSDDSVGCVSGLVLPAQLDTTAQVNFEQFGGHSKGRGFQRVVFDERYLSERQSPMYPLPPFGVGANMTFRKQALRDIGGFDVAIGAGTPVRGAEDTLAFSELLLAGWQMVYSCRAVTWHYHRTDDEGLLEQLSGYGLGLGAYYAALVTKDPRRIAALVRLAPQALHDLIAPGSLRNASLGDLPAGIARANSRMLLAGPLVYWRERLRTRRDRRSAAV